LCGTFPFPRLAKWTHFLLFACKQQKLLSFLPPQPRTLISSSLFRVVRISRDVSVACVGRFPVETIEQRQRPVFLGGRLSALSCALRFLVISLIPSLLQRIWSDSGHYRGQALDKIMPYQ